QLTVQENAALARLRDTAKALSAWVGEQAYGGPKATPPGGLLESLCGATDLLCQALSETGLDNNRPTRPSARHSSDFRSVHWYGNDYTFTNEQSRVIEQLWKEWENGTPEVGQLALLNNAKVEADRVQDVFKSKGKMHPAWNTMIIPSYTSKGTLRLNP